MKKGEEATFYDRENELRELRRLDTYIINKMLEEGKTHNIDSYNKGSIIKTGTYKYKAEKRKIGDRKTFEDKVNEILNSFDDLQKNVDNVIKEERER